MMFNIPKLGILMVLAILANVPADLSAGGYLTIAMTACMMLVGAYET